MTIDELRAQIEALKGENISLAESAETRDYLIAQGWDEASGQIPDKLAQEVLATAQQRYPRTGGPEPLPTPSPGPEGPSPGPTNPGIPPPGPTPTPTPTPGGPNPLPTDPSGRVGEIVNRIPGSFYTPPDRFNYPDFVGPEFQIPDFEAPSPFQYADYAPISGEEALKQDPGYGLRSSEGIRAMRNAASADGLGKSVGTLKGLMEFAGSLASQEYGAADARNFRNWQTGRQAAESDYDRLWRNKLTDYGLKYGEQNDTYDRALTAYDTNLKTRATGQGFDLDAAAGMAGGRLGATSLAGNLTLGQGNLDLGRNQLDVNSRLSQGTLDLNRSNSRFQNLLDLYRLSTKNLPNMPTSEASFL